MNSFKIATTPLSGDVRATVLPGGHMPSDTSKLLLYLRLDHEGRLAMGGRGCLCEPTSDTDWAHLERVLAKMYPQAAGTPDPLRALHVSAIIGWHRLNGGGMRVTP